MVRPGGAPRRASRRWIGTCAGFTLVEVLVAVMVFGVGVLGAVATLALAARILREARAREAAVLHAGAVLDSLAQLDRIVAGERRDGRFRLRWWPSTPPSAPDERAAGIELAVEYGDGTARRRLRFRLVHLPPVPRVGEPW